MTKDVLIIGAGGFVGKTLLSMPEEALGEYGVKLIQPSIDLDITNSNSLLECLAQHQSDAVIHLAGQTFVPESFLHPEETFRVNFLGTLSLLKVLKQIEFQGKLLYVGSADVYGTVDPHQLPIRETQPLKPRSPYAVSKVAAEALCFQWSQTESIDIVMTRPFNHIGPGQSERFAISDFARQIAEIKLGRKAPLLTVGNIDVTRDFTDVADIIRAYLLLLSCGVRGEIYNVCSGVERSVRGMIDAMLKIACVDVEIQQETARVRAVEQKRVVGSYEKLHQATGWRPEVAIEATLTNLLAYWENKVSHG
jgi:GDP-4-dehydro-6-deoxy-D-mannose reductase